MQHAIYRLCCVSCYASMLKALCMAAKFARAPAMMYFTSYPAEIIRAPRLYQSRRVSSSVAPSETPATMPAALMRPIVSLMIVRISGSLKCPSLPMEPDRSLGPRMKASNSEIVSIRSSGLQDTCKEIKPDIIIYNKQRKVSFPGIHRQKYSNPLYGHIEKKRGTFK